MSTTTNNNSEQRLFRKNTFLLAIFGSLVIVIVFLSVNGKKITKEAEEMNQWMTKTRVLSNENEFKTNGYEFKKYLGEPMETDDDASGGSIDDFIRQDKICVNYIKRFLEGSTDAKDECEGVLNEYTAAECSNPLNIHTNSATSYAINDLSLSTLMSQLDSNVPSSAPSLDDILIDDFIENWECCSAIHNFYGEHCRGEAWGNITGRLLGFVTVFVICVVVKSFIQKYNIHWLPQSAGCILVGAFAGGILKLDQNDVDQDYFSNNLLMIILLPPIVFSAALKINKRAFRIHSIPIIMYASLGTLLSAVMTGFIVYTMTNSNDYFKNIPLIESLTFGALISSIDPVVVLNILEGAGITDEDTLYVVLFGESILNDAIAIVLFDTLVGYLGEYDTDPTLSNINKAKIWAAAANFLFVLVGSLSIGLLSGVCSNMFFRCISGTQSPVVEVSIFTAWAMIPYYVCNLLNLSGIVALVAAGFFMDMYIIGSNHEYNNNMENQNMNGDRYMLLHPDGDETDMPYGGASLETCIGTSHERSRTEQPTFSLNGQLSKEARLHTAFVAEVISSVAETCIFAYLGAFLFSSSYLWGWGLNFTAIVACIGGRAGMIIVISIVTNVLEIIGCNKLIQIFIRNLLKLFEENGGETETMTDFSNDSNSDRVRSDESVNTGTISSSQGITIDCKMQIALIFSGLRGAVSLALVQSIPLYNAMTKRGTIFKPELKTMTSTSIIFTVFIFGGLTRRILNFLGFVQHNRQNNSNIASNHQSLSSAENM